MTKLPGTFGALLRQLRIDSGFTQEELAGAAGLSPRSVSDLERGVNLTARKETARLLADALNLTDEARVNFEALARGRPLLSSHASNEPMPTMEAAHTLPRDITSFTGREHELRQLLGVAPGGIVGICAIGGMAGIGKTAFAIHAAHLLAPRFPDGQIFLPLHGHMPGKQPTDPADALASLLLAIGVQVQQIPPGLEARMALWRDRLADRQLLLVFDDAVGSEQIAPLLPSSSGGLVLVTSRRHLSALDDVTAISLDTLSPEEAARLFVKLTARPGLNPEDIAVREVTSLCGYLPLAVGMLARQLHHHPAWGPADLVADLVAARERLALLTAESLSVAAAFDRSYQDLTAGQRRMFRRLALHPGPDIDAYAATALSEVDLRTSRRELTALYDHYLLIEIDHGRYRLHDLIREHARSWAEREDTDYDRDQAIRALLDYYQSAAEAADRHLARYERRRTATRLTSGATIPNLPDRSRALHWERVERANLLACLDYVTHADQHASVVAMTAALASLLRQDGPWAEAIARHLNAVRAARALGDQRAEADALVDLGIMQHRTGDHQGATATFREALRIARDMGDLPCTANALHGIGDLRRQASDYPGALEALREALGIRRETADRRGQAHTLGILGDVQRLTGNYSEAGNTLREALDTAREIGDQQSLAGALQFIGSLWRQTGDYPEASDALKEALDIYRDLDDKLGQAGALSFRGDTLRQLGDYPRAADALKAALDLYHDLGDRLGEAIAWMYLGVVWRLTRDYRGAARALETALVIFRDIGDRGGEVEAINEVGTLHLIQGDLSQAQAQHQQALNLARTIGSAWDEAHALAGLGRCALAAQRLDDGEASLRRALEIFQRIGAGEASGISVELQTLRPSGLGNLTDRA